MRERSVAGERPVWVQDTFCVRVVLGYNDGEQITPAVGPKCEAGRPMPKRKLSSEQLAAVKELAKQWGKIVAKSAYGPDGPPLDADFDEMEQIAAAATAGLVEGTLEHLTNQQAQQLPDELPCPTCQKSCPVKIRPRKVVARGGHHHAPRTRRSRPQLPEGLFPPNGPTSNLTRTATARRYSPRSSAPEQRSRHSSWPPRHSDFWPRCRSAVATSDD